LYPQTAVNSAQTKQQHIKLPFANKIYVFWYLHTVARCNIFVDDLLSVQIVEAGVDLDGHVHQLLSGQRVGQTGLTGALPALQ